MSELLWLRPLWLVAIPALAGLWWWGVRQRPSTVWERVIPPPMLRHLLVGERQANRGWHALLGGWLLAAIALAGPSWREAELPATRNQQAVVIVLDLSPSMRAADLAPDRLTRARFKIIDLLRRRADGLTALVVYAGDAHTVVPLTDDVRTIEALLPALAPETMPLPGSNTEAALALAAELLDGIGQRDGHIVLVTDGTAPAVRPALRSRFPDRYRLSVLAVGTAAGAPIPGASGGFVTAGHGDIVLATVDHEELRQLAAEHGGRYAALGADDADVMTIADAMNQVHAEREQRKLEGSRRIASRIDDGYWMLPPLLVLAAFAFRRGVLFVLLLGCVLLPQAKAGEPAEQSAAPAASQWHFADLWLRRDQQGARALAAGDAGTAAQRFVSPGWSGFAHYRNQDYAAAAERFAAASDPVARFNLGNALARQGKFQEAIAAYQAAIEQLPVQDPLGADARFNKELIERQLREQQPPPAAQQQGSQQSDQSQQSQQQSDQAGEASSDQAPSAPADRSPAKSSPDTTETDPGQPQADDAAEPRTDRTGKAEQDATAQAQRPVPQQQVERPDAADQTEPTPVAAQDEAPLDASSEQWLRAIPDDPAGLLRRKFSYETELARRSGQQRENVQQEQRY